VDCSAPQRVAALTAVAGVVAGEGAYLLRVPGVATAGRVELMLGIGVAGRALAIVPAPARSRVLAVGGGIFVAAGVYLAYRLPTLG
jgi:hypothetical protein